jgi:hypothetical protein
MTFQISISALLACVSHDKNVSRRKLRNSALQSFKFFVGQDDLSSDMLTKDYIEDYQSWSVKCGSSPKTIDLYRDAIKVVLIENFPDAEFQIRQAFKRPPSRRGSRISGLNVEQLRTLSKSEFGGIKELVQARDLFMFSVYCGGLDYNAVKSMTKSAVADGYLTLPSGLKIKINGNIQTLITLYDREECNELFPICKQWSEALYADKLKTIGAMLRMSRIKDRHAEAKAWLSVAKDMKIKAEVMAACAYKHVDVLTHYTGEVSTNQKAIDSAIKGVCRAVIDNTEHWYAMKLRDRVTPEIIQKLLCENEEYPYLRQTKTYYPMEDIKVRVGGKLKQDTRAFIKNVLFFRTRERYLKQVYNVVQYSAWIFRETNSASSRYAVISQRDMENFQRAVSQYTDDIAITIVDNQDIKVGKKVRLTKGEFAGCEGVIECEDVDNDSQLRNFYIRFTTNNSFKFQIKVSPDGVTLLD